MHDKIVADLKDIILKRFKFDFNTVDEDDYEISFFSPVFRYNSTDMLYLFFDVEKRFNITIPESDIENNLFSSFNSIVRVIERQLEKNND